MSGTSSLVFAAVLICSSITVLAQVPSGNTGWFIQADSKDVALFITTAAAAGGEDDNVKFREWFQSYKDAFYKNYSSKSEEEDAFNNFKNFFLNYTFIINTDPSIEYWFNNNQYADVDFDTFRKTVLMVPVFVNTSSDPGRRLLGLGDGLDIDEGEVELRRHLLQSQSEVDWRPTGKVTPVKDQKSCGSCWAYAATSAMESAYLISKKTSASKTKIDLSEQQLIDCANKGAGYGSNGCRGGCSDCAMRYVIDNFQMSESAYPNMFKSDRCKAPKVAPSVSIKLGGKPEYPLRGAGATSEARLMAAVAKQPVVIYFCVASSFWGYAGGIYEPTRCNCNVNHGMVAVGYKYTGNPKTSYWIIRNSWGAWWGIEGGYIKVRMTGDRNGPCNMYTYASVPPLTIAKSLPKPKRG